MVSSLVCEIWSADTSGQTMTYMLNTIKAAVLVPIHYDLAQYQCIHKYLVHTGFIGPLDSEPNWGLEPIG